MFPFVRDSQGGSLGEDVAYWTEHELRRHDAGRTEEWVVPMPHLIHGYKAWFRDTYAMINGRQMVQLVARFDIFPLVLFAVPRHAWRQRHDVHMPSDMQFNPLWFANERITPGPYHLRLMEYRGSYFVATTCYIPANSPVYLYYGNIDNRNWASYAPTQREVDHQRRITNTPNGWPSDAYIASVATAVARGFHRMFPDEEVNEDESSGSDFPESDPDVEVIEISDSEESIGSPPALIPPEAPVGPVPPQAAQVPLRFRGEPVRAEAPIPQPPAWYRQARAEMINEAREIYPWRLPIRRQRELQRNQQAARRRVAANVLAPESSTDSE